MRKITAIVLAAGRSRRMGCSKPLLPLAGRPAIRWCLEALRDGGVGEIVVVLNPAGTEIVEAISDLPVTLAWNREPDSDMASSVRIGFARASPEALALLVCPADYPLIAPATIRSLLAEQEKHPEQIVIPTCQGRQGHPVIFPRPVLAELAQLPTLRELVRRDSGRICHLAVDDEAILLDMDTPDDYRNLQARLVGRSAPPVFEPD